MYPEGWGRFSALVIFVGFNLTFLPQFVAGYLGMPRRYHAYRRSFQCSMSFIRRRLNFGRRVVDTFDLSRLVHGYGKHAEANTWHLPGLEWRTASRRRLRIS